MDAFVSMVERLKQQGYDQSAAESQASLALMDQDLNARQGQAFQGLQEPVDQGVAGEQPMTQAPQQQNTTPSFDSSAYDIKQGLAQSYDPNAPLPEDTNGQVNTPNLASAVTSPEIAQYQYVNTASTDSQSFMKSLLAFGMQTLLIAADPRTQNWGQALVAGLNAGTTSFFNDLNKNKRIENKEALRSQGFTDLSIDEYFGSGDNKVLKKGENRPLSWMDAAPADGYTRKQLIYSDTGEPVVRNGEQVFQVTGVYEAPSPYQSLGGNAVYNKRTGQLEYLRDPNSTQGTGGSQDTVSYGGYDLGVGVHNVDGKYIEVAQSPSGKLSIKPSTEKKYNEYTGNKDTSGEWEEGDDLTSPKLAKMKLNEGQSKAVQHVRNGAEAIQEMEDALFGTDPSSVIAYAERGVLPNFAKEEDRQLFEVAGDRLIMTILRPESGAAITEEEMKSYRKTYLPQPGDSTKVVDSKLRSLRTRLNGLADGTGPALQYSRQQLDTAFSAIDARKESAVKKKAKVDEKMKSGRPSKGEDKAPASTTPSVTRVFGGKTYVLTPGADPRKQDSWKVQ